MDNEKKDVIGYWHLEAGKKVYETDEEHAELLREVARENEAEGNMGLEAEELDALERPVAQARVEFRELLMRLNGREW